MCFDYGVDREGKRVRKYRTFDTKRDAIRAFNEHKVKMDRGRRSCRAKKNSRTLSASYRKSWNRTVRAPWAAFAAAPCP
ncbi:hypothetical protein [uncultured Megasphaera sp.]|uniref:hypothetical protein n=1 Tax=uncultured Megasphaera sp. TaxID=165188 RepID=UPI00339037A4